jgi:hypothetical protein
VLLRRCGPIFITLNISFVATVSQFSNIRALGTMEKLGRIYNVAYCFIYGSLLHWQAEAATF